MNTKAKVESTHLGYDSRLGTASIYLELSGDGFPRQRFGGTFGDDALRVAGRLISICKARHWEDVAGKEIIADVEDGKVADISDPGGSAWFGRLKHVSVPDLAVFERYL